MTTVGRYGATPAGDIVIMAVLYQGAVADDPRP
jgi:hypothetical protein